MKKIIKLSLLGLSALMMANAHAAFQLQSTSFQDNTFLSYKFGYCKPNGKGKVDLSHDISPELSWRGTPTGTKSYVLTIVDVDGADSPHFDQSGYTLAKDLARVPFAHWIVANIPAHLNQLPEGAGSENFVAGGKKTGPTQYGLMGINDYTFAFASQFKQRITFKPYTLKQVKGIYGRYDGPCAPWNDLKIHHIVFTLYAMKVAKLPNLPLNGMFTLKALQKAMIGHVLAKTEITAKYVTNAKLIPKAVV